VKKKLLNEFLEELNTPEWKEIFKNEARIVMVLDKCTNTQIRNIPRNSKNTQYKISIPRKILI
jgi:hypothetical protein